MVNFAAHFTIHAIKIGFANQVEKNNNEVGVPLVCQKREFAVKSPVKFI